MVDIAVAQLLVAHGAAGGCGGDRRDHGGNDFGGIAATGPCGDHKTAGQHGVIDLQHGLVILPIRTQTGRQLRNRVGFFRQSGQHIVGALIGSLVPDGFAICGDELARVGTDRALDHTVIVQVDVPLHTRNGGQHGVFAGDIVCIIVIECDVVVEIQVGGDGDVLIARIGDAVDQKHVIRIQMEVDGADIFQIASFEKAVIFLKAALGQRAGLFISETVLAA